MEIKAQTQFDTYIDKFQEKVVNMKYHKIHYINFEVRIEVRIYDELEPNSAIMQNKFPSATNNFWLFDIPDQIIKMNKNLMNLDDGKLNEITTVSSKQISQSTTN